jgi:hypothetical protein
MESHKPFLHADVNEQSSILYSIVRDPFEARD